MNYDNSPSRGRGRPRGSKNKAGTKAGVLHGHLSDTSLLNSFLGTDLGYSGSDIYTDPEIVPAAPAPEDKKSRGRPKGTKNKPGHKAGRPRKSDANDSAAGSAAAAAKRPRVDNTPTLDEHPLAGLGEHQSPFQLHQNISTQPIASTSHHSAYQLPEQLHLQQQQQQHQNNLQQAQVHHSMLQHHHGRDSHALAGDIPVDPSLMTNRQNSIPPPPQPLPPVSRDDLDTSRYVQSSIPSTSNAFLVGSPIQGPSDALSYFTRDHSTISQPTLQSPQITIQQPKPNETAPISPSRAHPVASTSKPAPPPGITKPRPKPKRKSDAPEPISSSSGLSNVNKEVGLGGVVRHLLPKDLHNSLPNVSGPFQLLEVNGKKKLEGPINAATLEDIPGPVYVYIANYQPPPNADLPPSQYPVALPIPSGSRMPTPSREGLGTQSGLAPWKITNPLTAEGKARTRGPRKCGHCGKFECRGRGGRSWCPLYKRERGIKDSEEPEKRPHEHDQLLEQDDEQDELDVNVGDLGASASTSYSMLANFRGDQPVAGPSSSSHPLASVGASSDQVPADVLAEIIKGFAQHSQNQHGDGADDRNIYAGFDNVAYGSGGASSSGGTGLGAFAVGSGLYDPELQQQQQHGQADEVAKKRAPRHCALCGRQDCAGKTQRARCKEYKADSIVMPPHLRG
ncbi:hypothetical protein MNV49_000073 [Pseudohyphozyma bogoriensis]|nr:hypothetical protein MNV49_000073 [Pseudohyphozyma bogoriensis]